MIMLKALWGYRGFILGSVKREFQLKYRNSMLGAAWTVINPLAMILVYTVIFGKIMKARLTGVEGTYAYSIHLCAGLLTWGLFAEITSRAQNVFIENANLLKKLSFPRITLPVIVVMNALVNFTIIFGLFLLFLLLTGSFPGWSFLAFFPLLLIEIIFAIGLGITLGVLNVFFRDVGQFFAVAIQFWFWLTPIVYTSNTLSERLQSYLVFNPMTALINAYQTIFVFNQWPQWQNLWFITTLGIIFLSVGFRLFRVHAGEMVDEL